MKQLSNIQKLQIKNTIIKILYVPGNYHGGILEIALVIDCSLSKEELTSYIKDILLCLRKEGTPFLNLRINLLQWQDDAIIKKEQTSFPAILTGTFLSEFVQNDLSKNLDHLSLELKKYYARSKVILVFTKECPHAEDNNYVNENLQPFVGRKTLYVLEDGSLVYPLLF